MWLTPQWKIPSSVRALYSARCGGASLPPYESMNLAANVGDDINAVYANRRRLTEYIGAPIKWLRQQHTNRVIGARDIIADKTIADAAYTDKVNIVCAVTTADCLPILFCDANGDYVAAAHAGWRGLANGILENTCAALRRQNAKEPLYAWIGPAISRQHYEIGDKVKQLLHRDKGDKACFVGAINENKWLADLPRLAINRLNAIGVKTTASGLCAYSDSERFFSARRDGIHSGRIATMIWLVKD